MSIYESLRDALRNAEPIALATVVEGPNNGAKLLVRPGGIGNDGTLGDAELDRSRRQVARLEAELERTKMALEIMGKAHALLELISESADTEPRSKR